MKKCYISYSCWTAFQFTTTFCRFLNMLPYWWTLFFPVLGTDYLYLGHSTLVEILQCELHKALRFLQSQDWLLFICWLKIPYRDVHICMPWYNKREKSCMNQLSGYIRQLGAWSWWWWWRWDESCIGYSSNPNACCMLANWFGHNRASCTLGSMAHSLPAFKWKFWG